MAGQQERLDRERWVKRTYTLMIDIGTYGDDPDDEEIAYLLRMGGIDAMVPEEES